MTDYFAMYCNKCKRHFMSTSRNNAKCAYCNSKLYNIINQSDKARLVSELVRQLNNKMR